MKTEKLLREDATLYILHKKEIKSFREGYIECNKFYAGVQPDYSNGITKEDAIGFAKEIQHRFNNFYPMLEALKRISDKCVIEGKVRLTVIEQDKIIELIKAAEQ
jgi:hypothetical protein